MLSDIWMKQHIKQTDYIFRVIFQGMNGEFICEIKESIITTFLSIFQFLLSPHLISTKLLIHNKVYRTE